MASNVEIVNSALTKIGANPVVSLTEGSKSANSANRIFDAIRDNLLRGHLWNFATKRAKLARLSTAPSFGFEYKYQLPTDFLRLVDVFDNESEEGDMAYRLETDRTLHADAENVYLKYIAAIEDPNEMTADFRETFAYELASQLSIPIAQSSTLREQMKEESKLSRLKAISTDAMEDFPDSMPNGSWVDSRNL